MAPFGTEGTSSPYAFHSSGLNALMGDGSVRFVNQSIQVSTFASMVTKNAGEVIIGDN
jgi:prepilin-type processing-associated H-X9-DG protein